MVFIIYMKYDTNKWIYENDSANAIRYVIGTRGNKPLLCFGVNPSTAEPDNLDRTLQSVERLSIGNGFDSWIMMNLYPQRATNPNNIHFEIDKDIRKKNLQHIKKILSLHETVIWAGWGTLIEKRNYLIQCLLDILNLSSAYNAKWVSIGKISKNGHPHHPLYLNANERTVTFAMENYIYKIKNID